VDGGESHRPTAPPRSAATCSRRAAASAPGTARGSATSIATAPKAPEASSASAAQSAAARRRGRRIELSLRVHPSEQLLGRQRGEDRQRDGRLPARRPAAQLGDRAPPETAARQDAIDLREPRRHDVVPAAWPVLDAPDLLAQPREQIVALAFARPDRSVRARRLRGMLHGGEILLGGR
jgi:hypothetical protein